jgi:uncharacterized protein (TIGR04255 family)
MRYEYPRLALTRDPLSLVLCQVRFSPIRKMPQYVPEIQDRLRHHGFPNDASSPGQTLIYRQTPDGSMGAAVETVGREEFRTKDERWAVVIEPNSLALVTTAYDRYEGFCERFKMLLEEVDRVAELRLGQIHRVGIRYVDVINPREGETFRDYLQVPLHGLQSDVILGNSQVVQSHSIGRTQVGMLAVRIWQNNQGHVIPPDIVLSKPMTMRFHPTVGSLLTLVDTDHFLERAWDYDLTNVMDTMDSLHQGAHRAWFNDIITPRAREAWGACDA